MAALGKKWFTLEEDNQQKISCVFVNPMERWLSMNLSGEKNRTPEVRKIFEREVCPGIMFDTAEDWIPIYEKNGYRKTDYSTGSFLMMTLKWLFEDEGTINSLWIMVKIISRIAFLKKMIWLLPRIMKVKNSLGYIVLAGEKISWL